MENLMKLQKPASVQIDERVDARIVSKMDSTVIDTVQKIFVDNLNPNAFKKGSRKHKKKQGSGPGDKKHKSSQNQLFAQQTAGINPMANTIPSTPIIATTQILPSQFAQPMQRGNANKKKIFNTLQVLRINCLSFTLTSLEQEEVFMLVRLEELLEGEVDVEEGAEDLPEIKVRMMLIVWMLHQ